MINKNKILCIIPAKSISIRLPNKNFKYFDGNPLFYRTYLQAKRSRYIDDIFISTDSIKIEKFLKKKQIKIPFLRPKKYSGSKTKSETVVKHVLRNLKSKYNSIILLQPTSPLRTTEIIDDFIKYFYKINSNSLISINLAVRKDKNLIFIDKYKKFINFVDLKKNQSKNKLYNINGMIYCFKVEFFKKFKKIYDIDCDTKSTPSWRSIDIDTYEDFSKAKKYSRK